MQDSNSVLAGARAWMDSAPSNVVAVQGSTAPALISTNCDALAGWTPLWLSCYSAMAPSVFYEQGAFLLAVKPNARWRAADQPQRPHEFFYAGNRARAHHHALRFQFPEDHRHREQPARRMMPTTPSSATTRATATR